MGRGSMVGSWQQPSDHGIGRIDREARSKAVDELSNLALLPSVLSLIDSEPELVVRQQLPHGPSVSIDLLNDLTHCSASRRREPSTKRDHRQRVSNRRPRSQGLRRNKASPIPSHYLARVPLRHARQPPTGCANGTRLPRVHLTNRGTHRLVELPEPYLEASTHPCRTRSGFANA